MAQQILLVTKPFGPPWRDSSKNLARDLATHGKRYRYRVLAPKGSPIPDGPIEVERIYRDVGAYEPALTQNVRVAMRLAGPSHGENAYHFFFAPNPRTAQAARAALALHVKKRPTIHTVCSLPVSGVSLSDSAFADVTIALSAHGQTLLAQSGVRGVVRMDPCVPLPRRPEPTDKDTARRALQLKSGPVVLFAGDLEMGRGAPTFVAALPRIARAIPEATYVLACRAKTPHSRMAEEELKALVRGCGLMDRTRFMGETDRMAELLLASDIQVLPARSLEKKMDYPLVLLEGFARMLPAVVGDAATLVEMAAMPQPGCISAPSDNPDAVAAQVVALLQDDARRLEMGRAARVLSETRFNPDRFCEANEGLYDELLRRR